MGQGVIDANLAAVEAHFHGEASIDVEKAIEQYTDDIVWEAPARGLIFEGKEAVAENYRKLLSSIRILEARNLQRFATEDRVVDDTIATFELIGDGFVNSGVPVRSKVEMRLVHIFEMRDGQISRETGYEMWRVL